MIRQKEEDDFKAKVLANSAWKAQWGGAWDSMAEAEKKSNSRTKERFYHGMDSDLATLAANIVDT